VTYFIEALTKLTAMPTKPISLFLFSLFAFSATASSQHYALIDKKMKLPIIFTDSITVEQIKQGYFPIENNTIDTLIANINYLHGIISVRQRAKMESFELKNGQTTLLVDRVPFAYGDRYKVSATTLGNSVNAKTVLISDDVSNKASTDRIEKLIAYLKRNFSLFSNPYEIKPKLYNIVVVSE
jgi:hypothetical protein